MADEWVAKREVISQQYGLQLDELEQDLRIVADKASDSAAGPYEIRLGTSLSRVSSELIPPLEEGQFEAIPRDSRLKVRQVEENLNEAVRHLQECVQIRTAYREASKLYLDTRLKAEEFIRLDGIHQLEVDAGIYELPFREAQTELEATVTAANAMTRVVDKIEELFSTAGPLGPEQIKKARDNSTDISGWAATGNPNFNEIRAATRSNTIQREAFEEASWRNSLAASQSSQQQLIGRFSLLGKRAEYLKKDANFRRARTAVSRDTFYSGLYEHTRPNSPLNYSQQLAELRNHFDSSAKRLAARIRAVSEGAGILYGIELPIPSAGVANLNSMMAWLADAQERLQLRRRGERVELFTIWLSTATRGSVAADLRKGVAVQIGASHTGNVAGLLRGVAFEYVAEGVVRPIPLQVEPPREAIADLGVANSQPQSLRFGRVMPVSAVAPIAPQFSDIMWNGNPYGTWRVQSIGNEPDLALRDVAIHLWIAR